MDPAEQSERMEPAEQSEQSDRMESSKMTEQTEHMEQMEKTIRINDKLTLTFPEGFHVMDDEEKKTLRFLENGPGEALADPEHHIIVTIGWKNMGSPAPRSSKAGTRFRPGKQDLTGGTDDGSDTGKSKGTE